ncbi:hypothetical protein MXM51_01585 [Pantoea stewartii]|uniref:hypothetical protein n=1 Tax=Pantoea stewartii TaxID=66269 RepID=UPI002DC056E7|nr:hypothetical protein [Pantoea stewartii]MEB6533242.1 hypothetical protein [Pantoea stewartii]
MSEFKGTPGPWSTDRAGDVFAEGGRNDGQLGIVAGVAGADWSAEDVANANLIAAAPELLEALQDMVESYQYEASMENPSLLKARAAITKALGQ